MGVGFLIILNIPRVSYRTPSDIRIIFNQRYHTRRTATGTSSSEFTAPEGPITATITSAKRQTQMDPLSVSYAQSPVTPDVKVALSSLVSRTYLLISSPNVEVS